MSDEASDFENPWRKNYEAYMAGGWMFATSIILLVTKTMPIPPRFGALTSLLCLAMAAYRGYQAYLRMNAMERLKFTEVEFITIDNLIKKVRSEALKGKYWIGDGFKWSTNEAKKMYALLDLGIQAKFDKYMPKEFPGSYWLHGLAAESAILNWLSNLVGHTLITGTTRVGKTRAFDILIAQAIIREECVIIIDPKGDKGLAENAKRTCEKIGHPERFVFFSPAHPEKSVCIDPMRNYNRTTELASRVAALIPSETGADPFAAFGWMSINNIVNGLIISGERPSLISLKHYIEGGPDELLMKAFRAYFRANIEDWEKRVATYLKAGKTDPIVAYVRFYKEIVIPLAPSVELDGLVSMYEHNRDHFAKMVASLIPILSMLTSDPVKDLLSPQLEAGHDKHVTDISKIIKNGQVLYMGLDSLADPTVGSAIGSIALADATAVAGDRYNYGIDSLKPVNIFIDEAAEVLNTPAIQMMNKGGGADFRITIATQTFADFAARLGDENKARQVLANTNNKITFRVLDTETQKYIAEGIQPIRIERMEVQYGHNVDANIQDEYTASYRESKKSEDADLIPPAMLSELPPLHFFARLSGGQNFKGRIPILKAE